MGLVDLGDRLARVLALIVEDARDRMKDGRVGSLIAEGRVGSEAGERQQNRARVDLVNHLPADTEPLHHARPEVLDHGVAPAHQILEHGETFGLTNVEADVALSDVDEVEEGGHALVVTRRDQPDDVAVGWLHLDDLGTQVAEHP